jgi:hypothetical protein
MPNNKYIRCSTGDLLGYRFGGTEEAHLVPIKEVADPVEAAKQKTYVGQHPNATVWASACGKCVPYVYPNGDIGLTEVNRR